MEMNISNFSNSDNLTIYSAENFMSSNIMLFVSMGACFCMCLWVIILNGLLVICFWVNKNENWFSHSKNILSVIIIDLLVGITMFFALISSTVSNMNIYECITALSLCMASQTATSLNVLRFCILRLYVIGVNKPSQEHPASTIVLQTILIWIASSALVLVPFLSWADRQPVVQRCTWTKLFSTNQSKVDLYMFHVMLIPTVATTVLYGLLTLRLKRATKLVHPECSNSKVSTKTQSGKLPSKIKVEPTQNISNANIDYIDHAKILYDVNSDSKSNSKILFCDKGLHNDDSEIFFDVNNGKKTNLKNQFCECSIEKLSFISGQGANLSESSIDTNQYSQSMIDRKNFDKPTRDKKGNDTNVIHKSSLSAFKTYIHGANNDSQRTFLQDDSRFQVLTSPSTSRTLSTLKTLYEKSTEDNNVAESFTYEPNASGRRFISTNPVVNVSPKQNEKSRKFGTNEIERQVIPEDTTHIRSKLPRFTWLRNFTANNRNKFLKGDNIQGNVEKVTSKRTRQMKRVIATIGILLFLINVSVLPYLILLGINIISPDRTIPGIYGFLSSVFLLVNSASNPIIYAIRLKPLRTAFFTLYKRICCNVCNTLNEHS